jgi:hypothetical protein
MLILIKFSFRGYKLYIFAGILIKMLLNHKLNIVILFFLAFVFKVLAVNVSLFPSPNILHTNNSLAKYSSTIQKRKRNIETTVKANVIDFINEVVCEENLDDEEDLTKINSLAVTSLFNSYINRIHLASILNHKFDLRKCDLHEGKYFALSTLRI